MFAHLFLPVRFFQLFTGVIFLFLLSFPFPVFLPIAILVLVAALGAMLFDVQRLFQPSTRVTAYRKMSARLSLNDLNTVQILLTNNSDLPLDLQILDELPAQLQIRDFKKHLHLANNKSDTIHYTLRPLVRGAYEFGNLHLFLSTSLGLVQRRISIEAADSISVYPSVLQMKQMELQAFSNTAVHQGIKKIRRVGHSYNFDHVNTYVRGDDYRSINWRASGRRGTLMVNKYEDERAQQVYCIIDKSRNMRMPFEGLSLMDYAINSTLAISNIVLKKHDRAGLLTFSDKMGTSLKADNKPTQLRKILEALYQEKERPLESNYELLYYATRKLVRHRSLLLLFTNFESMYALDRVLPILRRINRQHLLVVIFFENSEVKDFTLQAAQTIKDIYHQTIAQNFIAEKRMMAQKLQQFGIQSVLTPPKELSMNAINKYLELKARGLS